MFCILVVAHTWRHLSATGAYSNMEKETKKKASKVGVHGVHHLDTVIEDMIQERRGSDEAAELFRSIDIDGNGSLDFDEFTQVNAQTDEKVLFIMFIPFLIYFSLAGL